jgi:hypothetical protein
MEASWIGAQRDALAWCIHAQHNGTVIQNTVRYTELAAS